MNTLGKAAGGRLPSGEAMKARVWAGLTGSTAAVFLLVALRNAPASPPGFSFPERLGFLGGDDWEPSIAADRFGHVYALWTHYTPGGGNPDPSCPECPSPHMELQISSDGGETWSDPRALVPDAAARQDDPQIVVDPVDGRTVYAGFMMGDKASMFVAKSTNFGETWSPVLVENLQRGTDKCILAVRGQRVYLVYNAVMKIYASVSLDGGATWTFGTIVSNTNSKLGWSLPSGGAIDSKGNAYFAWSGYEANGKPSGDVNLFVSKSADEGKTWTVQRVAVSGAPPQCGSSCGWAYWGAQMALAVDGMDRVYVLYNASSGKFAVNRMIFARSVDGGATWGLRQDVSRAPQGANNLFPAMAARGDGDVRIAWQDDRNGFDAGNDDPGARWNTYHRFTTDAGTTWSSEVQLSRFTDGYDYKLAVPREGYLEPYGDYFELDIDGAGRTHVLWGEAPSYAGPGNVWYSTR
jgi:BNR/Asp-box repeat